MSNQSLAQAFRTLADVLPAAQYPLPLDEADQLRGLANSLTQQVRDYLLPRATSLDAPLLAVVGGSTGSGKSTLVNSLLRATVTRPGVLRPTTKSPVLICHPSDEAWFRSDQVLPGLVRTDAQLHDSRALRIVSFPDLPPGLAILDAPDIDSIDDSNRALAKQLLLAADLWIFVTTAARYADAVPWDYLDQAAQRNTKLAVVINRCPASALNDVAGHFAEMLASRGLAQAKLFAIAERSLSDDQFIPLTDVGGLRQWLGALASQSEARTQVAVQSLAGSVRALDQQIALLQAGLERQDQAIADLRTGAVDAYRAAALQVSAAAGDGTMLRGEILARWQELVGTGDFMRSVEERISVIRDRIGGWLRGQPQVQAMEQAISDSLMIVLRDAGAQAAQQAARSWQQTRWGREILSAAPYLAQPTEGFEKALQDAVRGWQSDVLGLVEQQGAGKRMKARFLALGTNVVGAALIIVVFSFTGGLTATEVGIAGSASLLAQRLLEAVFGEGAVRKLAEEAKHNLAQRVDVLFAEELTRYMEILDSLSAEANASAQLDEAARQLRQAAKEAFDDLTRPEV